MPNNLQEKCEVCGPESICALINGGSCFHFCHTPAFQTEGKVFTTVQDIGPDISLSKWCVRCWPSVKRAEFTKSGDSLCKSCFIATLDKHITSPPASLQREECKHEWVDHPSEICTSDLHMSHCKYCDIHSMNDPFPKPDAPVVEGLSILCNQVDELFRTHLLGEDRIAREMFLTYIRYFLKAERGRVVEALKHIPMYHERGDEHSTMATYSVIDVLRLLEV